MQRIKNIQHLNDIHDELCRKVSYREDVFDERTNSRMVELQNLTFKAEPFIIDAYYNNDKTLNAEWYEKYYSPIVYGERYYELSQFQHCVLKLKNDKFTRQAFISFMDFHSLYNSYNDIMICTIGVHFLFNRDTNKLDMHVYMRSNDVLEYRCDYNYQNSVFENMLNRVYFDRGDIIWHTSSLQLFEKDFSKLL